MRSNSLWNAVGVFEKILFSVLSTLLHYRRYGRRPPLFAISILHCLGIASLFGEQLPDLKVGESVSKTYTAKVYVPWLWADQHRVGWDFVSYAKSSAIYDVKVTRIEHDLTNVDPYAPTPICPIGKNTILSEHATVNVFYTVTAKAAGAAENRDSSVGFTYKTLNSFGEVVNQDSGIYLYGTVHGPDPEVKPPPPADLIRRFEFNYVRMRNSRILEVQMSSDFVGKTYPVDLFVDVNGALLSKRVYLTDNLEPIPSLQANPIEFDLEAAKIPRFTNNALVKVTATVANVERKVGVWIPLPVIFVPGIDAVAGLPFPLEPFVSANLDGGNKTFEAFENAFKDKFWTITKGDPNGYNYLYRDYKTKHIPDYYGTVHNPFYPTLHTLIIPGYPTIDRNHITLKDGGWHLHDQIKTLLSKTYADKVNIIAHSKGCLITRAMFVFQKDSPKLVNHLIMIQGPHLGSVAAVEPKAMPIYGLKNFPDWVLSWSKSKYPQDVYRNLSPVWNFSKPYEYKKFTMNETRNPELTYINGKSMPYQSEIKYTIFYTEKNRTAVGKTYRKIRLQNLSIPFNFYSVIVPNWDVRVGGWGPGDYVVPKFSQLGFQWNCETRRRGFPITAFAECSRRGQIFCARIQSDHLTSMSDPDVHKKAWDVLWNNTSPNWYKLSR